MKMLESNTDTAIPVIPPVGEQWVSVNLEKVTQDELLEVAAQLGFSPKLSRLDLKSGVQHHAVLWHGLISEAPADLMSRIDTLADLIDPSAIRSVRGKKSA